MLNLVIALLLSLQEPSVAELLRRLDTGDIEVRDKTEGELAARGAPALAEVEAALASTDGTEFRIRLTRVVRKLRLSELTSRIPAQFSEGFRTAAPELMKQLKTADPGALIEAIAATTGKAWHWETVDVKDDHGTMKVAREITREPVKGATRADAAEVLLLAFRALPEAPLDARWSAVRGSARAAIRPEEGADRRRLCRVITDLRKDPDFQQLFQSIVAKSRDPEDIPFLLTVMDDPDRAISAYAGGNLRSVNPGSHADEIVKLLGSVKPAHQPTLLRCLQNSGDRKFRRIFMERLDDPDPGVQSAAFAAISDWEPETLTDIVMAKLKSREKDQIARGLQMALKLKKPGHDPRPEFVKEAVRVFLTHPDPEVSAQGLGILMWCSNTQWFTREVVLHGLSHSMAGVRKQAAGWAGGLDHPDVIAALKKALDDPDDETAAFASVSLYALKQPVPMDRVRVLLKSSQNNARSQAMRTLCYVLGRDARPDLAALLEHPDMVTQVMAIQHLATLGVDGYEEHLRKKLKDDYNVCIPAAQVLAPTGDAACWPVLKKYMGGEWHRLAVPAVQLAYPEKSRLLLAVVLKVPEEGTTAAALLENLRASLATAAIRLEVSLEPEALAAKVKRRTFGQQTEKVDYYFAWLSTLLPKVYWFFDGETVTILPRDKSRQRWVDWVKNR